MRCGKSLLCHLDSPLQRIFPKRGGIGTSGEAGARPIRDLSQIDVPLLHMLEHADNSKGASSSLTSWGNYLFPNLKDAPESALYGVADEDIFRRIQEHSQGI